MPHELRRRQQRNCAVQREPQRSHGVIDGHDVAILRRRFQVARTRNRRRRPHRLAVLLLWPQLISRTRAVEISTELADSLRSLLKRLTESDWSAQAISTYLNSPAIPSVLAVSRKDVDAEHFRIDSRPVSLWLDLTQ